MLQFNWINYFASFWLFNLNILYFKKIYITKNRQPVKEVLPTDGRRPKLVVEIKGKIQLKKKTKETCAVLFSLNWSKVFFFRIDNSNIWIEKSLVRSWKRVVERLDTVFANWRFFKKKIRVKEKEIRMKSGQVESCRPFLFASPNWRRRRMFFFVFFSVIHRLNCSRKKKRFKTPSRWTNARA